MQELLPNKEHANKAILFIKIVLFLEILNLISSYMQLDMLQQIKAGFEFSNAQINSNDNREAVLGILYTIVFFISAILFIRWFYRAYINLHVKFDNLKKGSGWAIGSWFVPIINLFYPYQIMNEMYVKIKELLPQNSNFPNNHVKLWWALWIISGIIGYAAIKVLLKDQTLNGLILSTELYLMSSLIGICLCFATIKVIELYSHAEEIVFQDEIKNSIFKNQYVQNEDEVIKTK